MTPDFETESAVARYRDLLARIEAEITESGKDQFRTVAKRLRKEWMDWQGEDSLHEMAFGELEE